MDGAPGHYHRDVRDYLDRMFPNRWIGRGCQGNLHIFDWPPRSCDLTPLYFFLWGYVKGITYKLASENLEDLKDSIRRSFNLINKDMLRNVREGFVERLQQIIVADGGHIENWRN